MPSILLLLSWVAIAATSVVDGAGIDLNEENHLTPSHVRKIFDGRRGRSNGKSLRAVAHRRLQESSVDTNLVSIRETPQFDKTKHTPFFWHIPKAGGTSITGYLVGCIRLVAASEVGIQDGHDKDETLEVIMKESGRRFVNVDTTTIPGIERAKSLHLVPSRLPEVIFSGFLHEGSQMFDPSNQGVAFTLFRHPVDRAVSLFYYLQIADWEPTYNPDLKNWSLAQYAKSELIEDNWMTRYLANKMEGELTLDDLTRASHILRNKFLIGLTSHMDESLRRFESFFGWQSGVPEGAECRRSYVQNEAQDANKHSHPQVQEDSLEYHLIMDANMMDYALYDYARGLFFDEQAKIFAVPGAEDSAATQA